MSLIEIRTRPITAPPTLQVLRSDSTRFHLLRNPVTASHHPQPTKFLPASTDPPSKLRATIPPHLTSTHFTGVEKRAKRDTPMCGSGGHDHPNQHEGDAAAGDFPVDLYPQLTDAHCHIQDDRENIHRLVQSWAEQSSNPSTESNASSPLLAGKLCLMGVQPSKDLGMAEKDDKEAEDTEQDATMTEKTASLSLNSSSVPSSSTTVVTVTWNDTDTKGDWDLVSKLAHSYPDRFVPCFGIHPWFTHKYRALETSSGPALELRRAGVGADSKPDKLINATSSPTLSFSANQLTSLSGSNVRHEDFLAMSKQLQEQMAKEGQSPEVAEGKVNPTSVDLDKKASVSNSILETNDRNQRHGSESTVAREQDPVYAHYRTVLGLPASAPEGYLAELAQRLPKPRALEPALIELRRKLVEHPHAVLGEIGLDRIARVPEPSIPSTMTLDISEKTERGDGGSDQAEKEQLLQQKKTTLALTSIQHQLEIVREQLKIAASLNRAVSFHCVQAYGHWHDFLIQEGKRVRQRQAHQEYQQQLQEIQAAGGTSTISPISPTGLPLSKRSAAKLKREARDAAWERHVASTLQESSEEEEDSDDEQEGRQELKPDLQGPTACQGSVPTTAATIDALLPPLPSYEPVLPPRLCMHSYGGSVDMLKAFTKLDHAPEIFFSFSILINGRLQERKLRELILAVPEDRLLIESDHHSHSQVDQLLVEMVLKVAEIRKWTVQETVEKTARNWNRFVYG
ncbi:hypothetical protein EC968_003070 [Mortierella alpina]|nr:hypothetical protein EC968_003070 [Mortierella alpina]